MLISNWHSLHSRCSVLVDAPLKTLLCAAFLIQYTQLLTHSIALQLALGQGPVHRVVVVQTATDGGTRVTPGPHCPYTVPTLHVKDVCWKTTCTIVFSTCFHAPHWGTTLRDHTGGPLLIIQGLGYRLYGQSLTKFINLHTMYKTFSMFRGHGISMRTHMCAFTQG